jgi:hypothetical protein
MRYSNPAPLEDWVHNFGNLRGLQINVSGVLKSFWSTPLLMLQANFFCLLVLESRLLGGSSPSILEPFKMA